MRLYLLSCKNIEDHIDSILPLLSLQRQQHFQKTGSALVLGAGLMLASILNVHDNDDISCGLYGKPSLSTQSTEFSLSHSKDHVLLGISSSLIGVDMEYDKRIISPSVQKRICLPDEINLDPLLVYTRKECAMKLTGLGFRLPFREINTTSEFLWFNQSYRFFSTSDSGFLISVLTDENKLSEIQHLTPEMLI